MNTYVEKYGDKVLIFDKDDIECETMDNDYFNKEVSLFARNFILEHAKKENYDYFLELDDDITRIRFRYIYNNSLKSKEIKDINNIIYLYIKFINKSDDINGIGLTFSDFYFGGAGGKFSNKLDRFMTQFMILKTNQSRKFIGKYIDDLLISISNFDKLYFSDYQICFDAPPIGKNSSGIQYKDFKHFAKTNEYVYVYFPSGISLKYPNFKPTKHYNSIFPKIISSKWKKV